MSRRAWVYISLIILLGIVVGAQALMAPDRSTGNLWTLIVLALMATIAQIYRTEGQTINIAFFATPVFFFAGVLLLNPAQLTLLIVVPHLIEWVVVRLVRGDKVHLKAWYIQPFNIAMYVLAGRATQYAHDIYIERLLLSNSAGNALTAILAAITYLVVNQAILGQVLVLARNISWKESEVLRIENLVPEFIMLCLGIVCAHLWVFDPWLIIPALTPLALMYRALLIPHLLKAAQIDSKTGLNNAGHFRKRFEEEFERARRFSRPLSVLMADLDLLRTINNTYGHLAGDAVLEGIGRIIRNAIREYDIAGRFGGEEFSLVLPETEQRAALEVADRIRREVEACEFHVPNSDKTIRATVSIGVAVFPDDGYSITDLVHEADIAVYQAKYQGRNRVICASDVPHSVKLEHAEPGTDAETTYAAAFRTPSEIALPNDIPSEAAPSASIPEGEMAQTAYNTASPTPSPSPGPVASTQLRTPHATSVATPGVQHRWWTHTSIQWLVIGVVSFAGIAAAVLFSSGVSPALVAILTLVLLAILAEWMQINVYGEHSMSVSMAIVFAAGLITSMPGITIVSAAIVITNQIRRKRTLREWYKALFNWAVHVLAGLMPLSMAGLITHQLDLGILAALLSIAVLAAAGYYIIETGLISVVIALTQHHNVVDTWRTQFRWLATYYVVLGISGLFLSVAYLALGIPGMLVFALPILMQHYAQQQYVARTNASALELRRMNAELSRANLEVTAASHSIQQLNSRLSDVNNDLFRTVGHILDARDPYVAGHSAQVAQYAAAIAHELGLPPERVELVYHAGLMHDIGKIAIREYILHKPGKLTPDEFEQMKLHTTIGAELLMSSPGLRHLAPLIRHHHERWDGNGYPDALCGEAIPLESRILAVCDTVEAMASDRPYRTAEPLEAIVCELKRCSGSQFEPMVVNAFVRLVERNTEGFIVNSARNIHRRTKRALNTVFSPS